MNKASPILGMWIRVRSCAAVLGAPLITLALVSLAMMFLANEDPFARDALCRVARCFYSDAALGWNKLLYDLSYGCVISVVFYWILVRLPEHRKRQRIKKSFESQYRAFKLACIENFLAVADGSFDSRLPEKLQPIDEFRRYFKQNVGDGRSRWDEVANKMSSYYMDSTLNRMSILQQEISFVMHNADISECEAFDFLKHLSQAMQMQRNAMLDSESMRSFLRFFWQLFAGWDWVEGYRARDIVEEMIEAI